MQKKGLSLSTISSWLGSALSIQKDAAGVCIDSRLLKRGELFIACEGNRCDGHAFLNQAAEKGAVGAVVSNSYSGKDFDLPLIKVESPAKSLQLLAQRYLAQHAIKTVAITGSMGKTTTKGFLAQLLSRKFKVASTPGNYNSQLGLPLAILNQLSGDEEILVLEMGMTLPGQISTLVDIAPPDMAIITGVALAHAENFDSLQAIARAKAEILSHSKTQLGIVNHDIFDLLNIASFCTCPLVSFSASSQDSNYSIIKKDEGLSLRLQGKELACLETLKLPGFHNLHNFLAAAVAAHHCGLSWPEIQEGVKLLTLPENRLQMIEKGGITFVNDAYNALPIAVKGALDSLPSPKFGGKKIAVLSEMRELGAFAEECHREIGQYALERVDEMICYGAGCLPLIEIWRAAGKPFFWAATREEIIPALLKIMQKGDVVLIKGSQASGFAGLMDKIGNP